MRLRFTHTGHKLGNKKRPYKGRGGRRGGGRPSFAASIKKAGGVWVLVNQATFEVTYFTASQVSVNLHDRSITIREGGKNTPVVMVLSFREFKLLWHYNKDVLISECEKRRFLVRDPNLMVESPARGKKSPRPNK